MSASARSHRAGSPMAFSGRVAKAIARLQAEPGVGLAGQREEGAELVAELVGADVDVGVVLHEVAHAREAVEDAGALVAVQPPYSARRSGRSR